MIEWLQNNETALLWLAATTIITFMATLIVVPILVVRIPSDYFSRRKRHRKLWANHHPLVRAMLLIGKNALGYILVVAGIIMLVLPGQGIFTILVGIMLLNFPGKYQLERWLATRRPVLRSINWLRQRARRAPLVPDG
jgi:Putative transmembrane protein (PGPGW)